MKFRFVTDRLYREEKILNWITPGLFIFITAFIWAPSRDAIEIIFCLAFFIPLLLVLFFRKPQFQVYGGWFTFLALIYAAYATLTSTWAIESKPGFFIIQWLVLASWLCGVGWLASNRLINIDHIFQWLLLVGSLIALVMLFMFYGHQSLNTRLESTFLARNPNEIGALFGILSLLAYCRWLSAAQLKESVHYFLLLAILLVPLFLSQSRGALLAFIICALMAIFYLKPSRNKILIHFIGVGTLGLLLIVFFDYIKPLVPDRLASGLRDVVWQEIFARSIREHLWFGIGLDPKTDIIIPDVDVFHHAHNAWLDTFYRAGLVGLILALAHVFYILKKFKPGIVTTPLYLWLMFGLIASMFDYRGFFWEIDFKWFLFWIPVGLITANYIQEKYLIGEADEHRN